MTRGEPPAIRIEPATSSDAPALARLRRHVHGLHVRQVPDYFIQPTDAEMVEVFRGLLAQDNVRAFVAYAGDAPVGYLLALIQERPATSLGRARRWLYLDQISVEPPWARRGLGRQLMRQAVEMATSLGIDELLTDVWAFNEEARAFALACGFHPQMSRFRIRLGT